MDVAPTSGSTHCPDADWCRDQGRPSDPIFADLGGIFTQTRTSDSPLAGIQGGPS